MSAVAPFCFPIIAAAPCAVTATHISYDEFFC